MLHYMPSRNNRGNLLCDVLVLVVTGNCGSASADRVGGWCTYRRRQASGWWTSPPGAGQRKRCYKISVEKEVKIFPVEDLDIERSSTKMMPEKITHESMVPFT